MSYTVNDLAQAVLQELAVLEAGQPVAAEDAEVIISRLPGKLAELNARDVGYIDIQNLEDAVFLPLVKIMAFECYNAFSVTDPTTIAKLKMAGEPQGTAEQTIKDALRLRTPRQTLRCEIFTGRSWWASRR